VYKNPLIVTSIPSEARWLKGTSKPIICCRASTCTCTSAVWCSCSTCMPCYWENGLRSLSAAPWVSVKKLFGSIWVLCRLRMKALLPTVFCVKINVSFGCEIYEESLNGWNRYILHYQHRSQQKIDLPACKRFLLPTYVKALLTTWAIRTFL
jgi:hypothetical protein